MIMSCSSVKICSLNIKGCKTNEKQNTFLSFFKKENTYVPMLQETHLIEEEHKKLKRDWVGQAYFSSFNSKR